MILDKIFDEENSSLNKKHILERDATKFFQDLFRENYIYFRTKEKEKRLNELREFSELSGKELSKIDIEFRFETPSVDGEAYGNCKNLFKKLAGYEMREDLGRSEFKDYLLGGLTFDLQKDLISVGWAKYINSKNNTFFMCTQKGLDLIEHYRAILSASSLFSSRNIKNYLKNKKDN